MADSYPFDDKINYSVCVHCDDGACHPVWYSKPMYRKSGRQGRQEGVEEL